VIDERGMSEWKCKKWWKEFLTSELIDTGLAEKKLLMFL